MARRNTGINVPVARVKVIKALEQALVKLETEYKNQETNEKKYQVTVKKWENQVLKAAVGKLSKATSVSVTTRYGNHINIDFNLPIDAMKISEKPERDFKSMSDWQYKDDKEEIENAIRVLKMCDNETINTATYGGITKYL